MRRRKKQGGNDSCPLPDLNRELYEQQPTHSCPAFKLGDARPKREKPEQDGLF